MIPFRLIVNKDENFRNIPSQELVLTLKSNIIFGENGSGKTNFIRSILKGTSVLEQFDLGYPIVYIPISRTNYSDFLDSSSNNTLMDLISENLDFRKKEDDAVVHYSTTTDYVLNHFEKQCLDIISELFQIDVQSIPEDINVWSDGYKSVLSIISDIIYNARYIPSFESFEDIVHVHMLVLIDEIDAFIHQSVQIKIVNYLNVLFPNIVFIFTTHSPTVIKGARGTSLFRLIDGKIFDFDSYYLHSIDTIAKDAFNTSYSDPDFDRLMEIKRSILFNEEWKTGKTKEDYLNILNEVDTYIGMNMDVYLSFSYEFDVLKTLIKRKL